MSMYPPDVLDDPGDDDGTMPTNVALFERQVVGRRIVAVEGASGTGTSRYGYERPLTGAKIILDDGTSVFLADTDECCAHTSVTRFLLHPERVDHVITGVATTGGFEKWHVYADLGDILELDVMWSCGNPFYYGYGFDIYVQRAGAEPVEVEG